MASAIHPDYPHWTVLPAHPVLVDQYRTITYHYRTRSGLHPEDIVGQVVETFQYLGWQGDRSVLVAEDRVISHPAWAC
jgi:hypothetical protein